MLHAEPFETKLLSAELCILFIYFLKGNCIGLEYHIILSKIHIIVIIKTKIIDQNKSCSNKTPSARRRRRTISSTPVPVTANVGSPVSPPELYEEADEAEGLVFYPEGPIDVSLL